MKYVFVALMCMSIAGCGVLPECSTAKFQVGDVVKIKGLTGSQQMVITSQRPQCAVALSSRTKGNLYELTNQWGEGHTQWEHSLEKVR